MGLRVMTVGSFDCLHSEHIELFKWCRRVAGDSGRVIVGINDDNFIRKTKGRAPIIPVQHRDATVIALGVVDETFINDQDDLRLMITRSAPDILMVGSDWHSRDYFAQTGLDWEFLLSRGVALLYAPSEGKVHSADFRERIQS